VAAEHELVIHRFAPAQGELADESYAGLRALWGRCAEVLGHSASVSADIAHTPPATVSALGTEPVLALAQNEAGSGQSVLRRHGDALCLSVALSGAPDWAPLLARWESVAGGTAEVLGEVRVLLAQTADVPTEREARQAAGSDTATLVGRFAVAERADGHGRARVRSVVVLGRRRDADQLSSWAWSDDGHLPPLAVHLLHCAKLRHHLRVWDGGHESGAVRAHLDGVTGELLDRFTALQGGGEVVTTEQLTRLLADEARAIIHATRLRDLRRAVDATRVNLAAAARTAQLTGGPSDESPTATWLAERLGDELAYLETALQRARELRGLVDTVAQRVAHDAQEDHRRRQERVNILQLAVVGAVATALGAIQALSYQVPLPGPAKPALVALLGTLALALALAVGAVAGRGTRLSWLLPVASGAVAAAAAWLVSSLLAGSTPAPAVIAAGAAFLAATCIHIWRRR
jgi:hypothetical protein